MPPYDLHLPPSDATFIADDFHAGAPSAPGGAVEEEVSHALVLLSGGSAATAAGGGSGAVASVQRRIPVGPGPLVIGRVATCDLVLEGNLISRAHCRVELASGQALVSDLGSTNGTFVDGQRITGPIPLQHGAVIQVGGHSLSYERRTRREVEEAAAHDRDLHAASAYVQSLLPQPIRSGPIRTDWLFLPCAQLGGSGFGTRWLSQDLFAAYMMGVVGHGTSAAMQSVAVMKLLRQPAMLGGTDLADPLAVVGALNDAAAGSPDPAYSLWYGVFDRRARALRYASAGHFPGVLVAPGGDGGGGAARLGGVCPAIGVERGYRFEIGGADVPPGAALFLLGDGVPELVGGDEDALVAMCQDVRAGTAAGGGQSQPHPTGPEPLRLLRAVRAATGSATFEEDFVALTIDFTD